MSKLPGADTSLWAGTTPTTTYPSLEQDDTTYDAIVVGGGITGIATAYLLQQQGKMVALIEKDRIVEWTTGGTTAKLSSQHYLIYDYLIRRHGMAAAQAFADANQAGIDAIEKLSQELGIDCDFSRRDAYVYSQQTDKIDAMKAEVAAAQQLGLPATFETTTDLPFAVTGAVKFSNQAQFHPRKFLLPLTEKFVQAGGVIYEETEATGITPGELNVVTTNKGDLRAIYVVQASGEPFWRNELFADHMWIKMSYALAARLKNTSQYPQGMYITTDDPMRTIRSAPMDGGQVMIFGGESHEYDEANFDADTHYANLVSDVQQRFDVDEVLYRWLAGDYMPYDRLPYIGADPDHPTIYVATGYRAWGLAWAMSAAELIVADVMGAPLAWAQYVSLSRLEQPVRASDKAHRF